MPRYVSTHDRDHTLLHPAVESRGPDHVHKPATSSTLPECRLERKYGSFWLHEVHPGRWSCSSSSELDRHLDQPSRKGNHDHCYSDQIFLGYRNRPLGPHSLIPFYLIVPSNRRSLRHFRLRPNVPASGYHVCGARHVTFFANPTNFQHNL